MRSVTVWVDIIGALAAVFVIMSLFFGRCDILSK